MALSSARRRMAVISSLNEENSQVGTSGDIIGMVTLKE
jgi:hypothetical protein